MCRTISTSVVQTVAFRLEYERTNAYLPIMFVRIPHYPSAQTKRKPTGIPAGSKSCLCSAIAQLYTIFRLADN